MMFSHFSPIYEVSSSVMTYVILVYLCRYSELPIPVPKSCLSVYHIKRKEVKHLYHVYKNERQTT